MSEITVKVELKTALMLLWILRDNPNGVYDEFERKWSEKQ